jgi:hypothetical protein
MFQICRLELALKLYLLHRRSRLAGKPDQVVLGLQIKKLELPAYTFCRPTLI